MVVIAVEFVTVVVEVVEFVISVEFVEVGSGEMIVG